MSRESVHLRPKFGRLDRHLDTTRGVLGASFANLGPSWLALAASWAQTGAPWAPLAPTLSVLGPSWLQLGSFLMLLRPTSLFLGPWFEAKNLHTQPRPTSESLNAHPCPPQDHTKPSRTISEPRKPIPDQPCSRPQASDRPRRVTRSANN